MKYANLVGSFYIEVSAKINLNIEKLFEEIANKLPKSVAKKDSLDINEKLVQPEPKSCQKC